MSKKILNDLVVNGKTEYFVLPPCNRSFYESYALNEFLRLFKAATGIDIPVKIEYDDKFPSDAKAISIGRTLFYEDSGVTADYEELKRDGYKIVTKNNAVILIGGGGYGTVYAVYGFFERLFGYRYYNSDEWKIDKKDNVKLLDFNVTDIPDIENRTGGFYYSGAEEELTPEQADCAIRMRTFRGYGFLRDGSKFFGSFAHTLVSEFLPREKYMAEHPDWYSPDTTQLCLSNKGLWDELVERVKQCIIKNQDSEYFMLGQSDTEMMCDCPRCLDLSIKYKPSGLLIQCINYVARAIKKWLKEYDPERRVNLVTLAYQQTETPPVVLDENGKYKPIDESVIPEDNVFIMLAPIDADYSVPINDAKYNSRQKKALEGWTSLTENVLLWTYCSNFDRTLVFFDNFHVIDSDYKICKEYKIKWFYDENQPYKQSNSFQAMLCFVHSQMAWDSSLKSEDLMEEFMTAFYKTAKPQMKEYLHRMMGYYKNKKAEMDKATGTRHGTYIWNRQEIPKGLFCKDFYDYSFLQEMFDLLTSGIKAIDENGEYDQEMKEKLKQRIMLERLTIRYLVGCFFASEFDKEDYFAYLDEFEKECALLGVNGLRRFNGLINYKETLDEWRKNYLTQK